MMPRTKETAMKTTHRVVFLFVIFLQLSTVPVSAQSARVNDPETGVHEI
jgi:hypothetical protein